MANTGWVSAGSALNNTVLGSGNDWSSLTNIVSNNNADVEATLGGIVDSFTNTLHCRQYGHAIGNDSQVDGVQARYERTFTQDSGTSDVDEENERFITDGSVGSGTDFANNSNWTTSRVLVTYGTSSNPQSLVESEIDGTNFGFGIRAHEDYTAKNFATAKVDYCQTIIYYTAAPAAPSGVTATQSGQDVVIDWTDNATDEDNYEVSVSVNAGGYSVLSASVAANAETYTDTTGYTPGDTLDYRVRALKTAGPDSSYANATQITYASLFTPAGLIVIS